MKKAIIGMVTAVAMAATPVLAFADQPAGQVADVNVAQATSDGGDVCVYACTAGGLLVGGAILALLLQSSGSSTSTSTSTSTAQ